MNLEFKALSTEIVRAYQKGVLDANGQVPEQVISDGSGNPCRHCLNEIPSGQSMLILAFRPFDAINPYSETGPIFLCGSECHRNPDEHELPEMFTNWEKTLIRGYGLDGRIVYGTGSVVSMKEVQDVALKIFDDPEVSYIHMRSASNNCYQCRIDRA